jgi:serine/threonine-protein kinase
VSKRLAHDDGCSPRHLTGPSAAVRAALLISVAALAACSSSGGSAHVEPHTPTPTPSPTATASPAPSAHVYVADQGSNSITSYAAATAGTPNQTPIGTISGSSTGLGAPISDALDAAGNIYVANTLTVTVYPANPVGTLNEAPTATINVGAIDGGVTPYGVGVDATGKIYVATPGEIFVFAANPVGTVTTPIATISGSNTLLAEIHNFAFDVTGRIYVTDNVRGILVFAPNPSGALNEAPVANIPRNGTTGLSYPWGIALDSSGNIYTLDTAHIYEFPPNPVGTVSEAPTATITGASTGLDGGNDGMAVDASGAIYAANDLSNVIAEFAANPSGTLNEAPVATIAGSNTGLNGSRSVAVTGAVYAASVRRRR